MHSEILRREIPSEESSGVVTSMAGTRESAGLLGLSFGAAEDYFRRGGQRVISDESPASAPLDLAITGLDLPRDLVRGKRAVGAFVIGEKPIRIRVKLGAANSMQRFAFVRAISHRGEARIVETPVVFEDGVAEMDLRVVGICTSAVGVFDENWTWEYRPEGGEFARIRCDYAGHDFPAFPVRLYFTAGAPLNQTPRESFYHVACSNSGATNVTSAEQQVWRNFTAFKDGQCITNARGEQLGFWRDNKPGATQTDYIDRDAQKLVTLTDSSCRGWAELFREALEIHGIAATVRAVRPRLSAVHPKLGLPTLLIPDGRGGRAVNRTIGLLVKPFKWKAVAELAPFPYNAEQSVIAPSKFNWKIDNPVDPYTARWPETDAEDLLRAAHNVSAHGSVRGIFGNHAVVLVRRGDKESWYDPSFGFGPHDSLLSYENDLLGRGEENHGGLFAIIGWKREVITDEATGKTEERNGGLLLGAAPAPATPVLEACDPG